MNDPITIAALALAVVLAAVWIGTTLNQRRRREVQTRLATVIGAPMQGAISGASLSLRRASRRGEGPNFHVMPLEFRDWLSAELAATGDRLKTTHLLIVSVICLSLVIAFLSEFLKVSLFIGVPLAIIAAIATSLWLLQQSQQRFQTKFVDGFADALDVIVRAVRGGLPVLDAMEAAVADTVEPVAGEFRRVLDELRIGVDLEDVLENAANRIRVTDFRFFAVSLVLQRRTGGALAEILANLSGLIRRRKEVRLKARALTAEARASAVLIGLLPVVLAGIMYLVSRDTISLLITDHRGNIILGISISILLTGFAVMKGMIRRATR
jgi:tight adherence protein B